MISILIQLVNLFHLTSIDSMNNKKYVTLLNNARSKGELRLSYLSNIIAKKSLFR